MTLPMEQTIDLNLFLVEPPSYFFPEIAKLANEKHPHGISDWKWVKALDLFWATRCNVLAQKLHEGTGSGVFALVNHYKVLNSLTPYTQSGTYTYFDVGEGTLTTTSEIIYSLSSIELEDIFIHRDLALRIMVAVKIGYVKVAMDQGGVAVIGENASGTTSFIANGRIIEERFRLDGGLR